MSTISASTTTTTAYKVTADTTGTLVLQTGASPTTAVTIDGSQNVGIGAVTPSTWKLDVKSAGTGIVTNGIRVNRSTVTTQYGVLNYESGVFNNVVVNTAGTGCYWNVVYSTDGSTVASTPMTLDASGNQLLGTTSVSAARLNVFSSNANRQIVFSNNETYYGSVAHNANTGLNEYRTEATGGHGFFKGTGSTADVTIDSSGNLLVGTTTAGAKLRVVQNVGGAGTPATAIREISGDPYGLNISYGATPNGPDNYFILASDNSAARFYVKSNGGIANYSANNSNLSDERTKTDIQDAGGYLAKICAIPVRTFKYKDQTDDLLNLGVIAQEVETVAPELVDVTGYGETPEDGVPLKAIYQTDLQYALMKCIQEQQAIIETLTNRIQALENK